MSDEQIKGIVEELFKLDDGDGNLTKEQIVNGLCGKVTKGQAEEFVKLLDQDGDGSLTRQEVYTALKKLLAQYNSGA